MNPTSYAHCNHNEKGMIFPRIRGGLLNFEPMGKIHVSAIKPFWLAHLPLSYPTTTIKSSDVSWGSYGWGVDCGRTVSPFPHAHSTSILTLMLARKPPLSSLQADSPLSLLILTHDLGTRNQNHQRIINKYSWIGNYRNQKWFPLCIFNKQ